MAGASTRSRRKTSSSSTTPTSSRASASGPTRSTGPGGATSRSGRGAAPASPSAAPAARKGRPTSGTSGPTGSSSSTSAALQSSLESRLRARMASLGSTLFRLTWKERATPSGRRICALRASVLRTSASDCTSWPSSTVSGWSTPQAVDGLKSKGGQAKRALGRRRNLVDQVQLAGWGTPTADEAGGTPEQFLERKRRAVAQGKQLGVSVTALNLQAALASWATPAARDYRHANSRSYAERGGGKKGEQLNNQVVHSGPVPTGSSAAMESGGQLNPDLSRWLCGLPRAWADCAPTVTPSSRRSRSSSSRP